MLNEKSQLQDKYYMILLHEVLKIIRLKEAGSRMVVARGWERGKWGIVL